MVGFGDNVPFFGTVRIPLPEAFLAEWYEFQGICFKVLTLPIRRAHQSKQTMTLQHMPSLRRLTLKWVRTLWLQGRTCNRGIENTHCTQTDSNQRRLDVIWT